MTTAMKRKSEDREIETLAMANCLMLLSHIDKKTGTAGGRIFTCKTCDRKFPSFQALGGHRASHKKPRLKTGDLTDRSPATKPSRAHGCPICGQEFALGQALGGHMRRHRVAVGQENSVTSNGIKTREVTEIVTPILKRSSSSSKRVVCLDLNLTPFENDVKFGMKSTTILPSWLIA